MNKSTSTLKEAALIALRTMELNHWAVADRARPIDVMTNVTAMDTLRSALDNDRPAGKPMDEFELSKLIQETPLSYSVLVLTKFARSVELAHGIVSKK